MPPPLRLLVLTLWSMLAVAVTAAPATPRPNVLFFFATISAPTPSRPSATSHIKTPNLDRLVKRGVAFRRAYMMGGMQGATCVPSRAMLLSGRSVVSHRRETDAR